MTKAGLNVLIVDDDAEDVMLVEGLLREGLIDLALRIDTADSFVRALSQIEKCHYDLLLFDYELGEKNGLDLISGVRARGIETPVILLTGRGDEEVAVEAMKLGASDYLPKSKLSQPLVRRSVRYALELHERESERRHMEQDLRQTNRQLEAWVQELEHLNEMGNALQTCVSFDDVYALVARRATEFFPHRSGVLCMLDSSQSMADVVAVWGERPPHRHNFVAAECWALRQGQPHRGSGGDTVCPLFEGHTSKEHFCVPMMASGDVLGVLVLQGTEQRVGKVDHQISVSQAQGQLALALSKQLSLALANLRLREDLRSQALHDPLTGLFNRRYMQEFLERSGSSAERHNRPLAVLILDIDHFKTYNDREGHAAGDDMLKFLGRFLQMHTRAEDIACRYGGDEFVLILPEVPLGVAVQRAEQLRLALKYAEPRVEAPRHSMPTIAVGISAAPEHGFSPEDLLRVADAALYRAKAEGRDRVVAGAIPEVGGDRSLAQSL